MATNFNRFDYRSFLQRKNIRHFRHITHVDNLTSIAKWGVLSRNCLIEKGIPFKDVSMAKVQNWRSWNYPQIHTFVPLFLADHTPMLYVLCVKQILQNELARINVKLDILLEDEVIFTNMNCTCSDVTTYNDVSSLPELKWDIIKTFNCFSKEYKKFKSAEVLVPKLIKKEFIDNVLVASLEVKQNVERIYEDEFSERYPFEILISKNEFY